MDAQITFDGTWRAKNDIAGYTDYKSDLNSTTYNDFLANNFGNGIPAAEIKRNWHLTAQFLHAEATQASASAPAYTKAENTAAMFSILANPTESSDAWLDRIKDTDHWGDNSNANTHSNMGIVSNDLTTGSGLGGPTNRRIWHDPAQGQVASRSSIMRLWYMADPAHHIDLSNVGGGNAAFYQNNNFDNPLVDVNSKTVTIDVPAGSAGVYVVFIPERHGTPPYANPFTKYVPGDIITKTIGPNTGAQTFTLTANVGPFINKAVWHYSCLAGYDLTTVPNPTNLGPVACAAITGCSDNFPFDCTQSMHSAIVGLPQYDPTENILVSTNGYHASNLDRYYGRYGHKAWEKKQEEDLAAFGNFNCQMPGTDPAITAGTMARGDILAVICLDDHERLDQITEMGLGDNIEAPQ
jgi:hypothetical protein